MEIYALILAGGSGERFWPLSRRALPKQLLRLVSRHSLLEETVERLNGLIPPARILILTNVEQEKGVVNRSGIFRRAISLRNQQNAILPQPSRSE